MRCVIARFPFELTKSGVLETMKGVVPEPVSGPFVTIGRRDYPAKQVGAVVTRQDRRDFSADEVLRAMTRLGFTCGTRPAASARAAVTDHIRRTPDLLGTPPAA
ncbi:MULTISPECIES: SCO5918 family protein [unclassified Streptomyces]|uniref:SCO5918 family protein n=1 Tax=unclassified Streptomyces TaxID=2593676 RepID=UPI0004C842E8|nr:SCO5918 family protein [Streptomyces sp. NRRL F-5727]